MSSQDSIPHVHCSGSVGSVNTEICKAKEVETEAGQAVYKKVCRISVAASIYKRCFILFSTFILGF